MTITIFTTIARPAHKICVLHVPISEKKENVFQLKSDNLHLTYAMENFVVKLRQSDIEVFHIDKNIIATEEGYYITYLEKDLTIKKEEV